MRPELDISAQPGLQRAMDARYKRNDLRVRPGDELDYRATLKNELYDHYAQGLYSFERSDSDRTPAQETFILYPTESQQLYRRFSIAQEADSGAQVAQAQVVNWHAASGNAACPDSVPGVSGYAAHAQKSCFWQGGGRESGLVGPQT